MYKRIIVFAAHYDDEITMAGTIFKMAAEGTEVHVVNITDGCEGYPREDMRESIVEMRKKEAEKCDEVLSITKRWHLDIPDMIGFGYTKEKMQECIKIIRSVRPEAVFTHGPQDIHNDHRITNVMTVDATWHAGQPVSSVLGDPWQTKYVFYYKGVGPGTGPLPEYNIDVSEYAHKRFEAIATQDSQFILFKKGRKELLEEGEKLKKSAQPAREKFWLADCNRFTEFPKM